MRHATLLLALMLISCSGAPRDGATLPRSAVRPEKVAVPPGIAPAALTPLTGDALHHANTSLQDVLSKIPAPPELRDAAPRTDDEPEPPVAAQRAYLAGRAAMRDGRRDEAVAQLEQVLRLAPRSAAAMRLLGQVYAAANDPIRASQYFTRAVQQDPAHAPSLFVLSRFALEQGDWARSLALVRAAIDRADDGPRADTAITQLGRYYTAVALHKLGYLRAAIDEYGAFLAADAPVAGAQAVVRELALVRQQDRATWQTLGDLHHQLGDPAAALAAYDRAATGGERGFLFDLAPRRVYTQLRLGRTDAALDLVFEQVRDTNAGEASLQLVRYLAAQGIGAQRLADELARIAAAPDGRADDTGLTLALADLAGRDGSRRILLTHLEKHPEDVRVFNRLIDTWGDDLPGAVTATADLMDRYPQHAELYGLTLLNAADDPVAYLAAFDALPATQRQRPMVRVLEGLALAGLARVEDAERAFDAALSAAPEALVARLQMAKVRVAQGRFRDAAALLEPLGEVQDPSVVALRVRVLTETGDAAGALALLDRMTAAGGADPSLVLQKARLQILLGDAEAGERTLLDALNLDPTREAYYEALFQMYDTQDPATGRSLIRDGDVQYRRLMRRMLGLIPDSRIGKLKRAELHAVGREHSQAIALLTSLVEQDHRDLPALRQLLGVLVEAQRTPAAIDLIEARLAAFARDPQLLQLAAEFFAQIGDAERTARVQEQLLAMLPEGDEKLLRLAALYLGTQRTQEAADMLAAALDKAATHDPERLLLLLAATRMQMGQPELVDADFALAFERYPDRADDLHYRWASTFTMRGDEAGYMRTLELTHRKFPDHAPTNNDLGYLWIEKHLNLDESLRMIEAAVEAEPDNPAYLDSLGWAYYKLGKFDDAVTWLRKAESAAMAQQRGGDANALATQVVVMDHLGDALYRQGDEAEANRVWRRAQRVLSNVVVGVGEELVKVRQSLADKTNALRTQTPVPVADVPGEAGPRGAPAQGQPDVAPPAPGPDEA